MSFASRIRDIAALRLLAGTDDPADVVYAYLIVHPYARVNGVFTG